MDASDFGPAQPIEKTIFGGFLLPQDFDGPVQGIADYLIQTRQNGRYDLMKRDAVVSSQIEAAEVIEVLAKDQLDAWSNAQAGQLISAAAVSLDGQGILIAGDDRDAVSLMVAKLVDAGWHYQGFERVALTEPGRMVAFCSPFIVPETSAYAVTQHESFRPLLSVKGRDQVFVELPRYSGKAGELDIAAVILVRGGGTKGVSSIRAAARTEVELAVSRHFLPSGTDGSVKGTVQLSEDIPALSVLVSRDPEPQFALDCLLRMIIETGWDAEGTANFIKSFLPGSVVGSRARSAATTKSAESVPEIAPPKPTAPASRPFKLTIGMATYDDYDGAYFTIQSIRTANPALLQDVEFLVIDNNPTGVCGEALKALEEQIPNYRYVPYPWHSSTAVRDFLFREAAGNFVLCVDCHILLMNGVLEKVLSFIDEHPDSIDFYQGPLINDRLDRVWTHFTDGYWSAAMLGHWDIDPRGEDPDAEPFDIPMQGLGLFLCRREIWPGINPRFRGFGGEEGYVQEKVRRNGGRTLCLPFLRWLHRFTRPNGVPYSLNTGDRIRNYLIGHLELGWDLTAFRNHFNEVAGEAYTTAVWNRVLEELANPFNRFGALWQTCLSGAIRGQEGASRDELEKLGIHRLTSWFPVARPKGEGRLVSYRHWHDLISFAAQCHFESVLLLDEEVSFDPEAKEQIKALMDGLDGNEWEAIDLGGRDGGPSQLPAIALHQRAYPRMLASLKELVEHEDLADGRAISFLEAARASGLKLRKSPQAIVRQKRSEPELALEAKDA